ncbi:hypothetical protein BU24DRAFT_451027 [Aaosphaeria arxii CBS 175.79]|uniref:Uncharacterized protein n=1 Tax=Aaosphaeria arxii CBS 175.79 TaxID=1450172 RepID=A0A6A5XU91_9PLEO|nr:uncharacterized protein BU24DRAFT_451027 [Aaosphaeria arxii CBS 175.79]KAF2016523.1 hypothetical protein BU24DRAFT_451027 [Aaosphaeria arxii CBS 175.79]
MADANMTERDVDQVNGESPEKTNTNRTSSFLGPLPPDVRESRQVRIDKDIAYFFNTRQPEGSKSAPSFKGIDSFTHAEVLPLEPQEPRGHNHQRRVTFLPLGGPDHMKRVAAGPDLPESVKVTYGKIKKALEEEPNKNDGILPITNQAHGVSEPLTRGLALASDERDADGDIQMGGAQASDPRTVTDQQRRSSISGPAGRTISPPTAGNTYDASRDPRRRDR